jgi:DNA-binding IclR family transcriptional regulator
MLGTVANAGRVLDLFTAESAEWGPTAVGGALGVTKSQAHELLISLHAIGLLRRGPGGRYRIGWRTLSLGRTGLREEFPSETDVLLRRLATLLAEPVELLVLDRERPTVILRHGTERPTAALLPPGDERPIGAPARCLLEPGSRAFQDLEETAAGLCGVAAPIGDGAGGVHAALCAWTTTDRWPGLERALSRAVSGIARRLESLTLRAGDERLAASA